MENTALTRTIAVRMDQEALKNIYAIVQTAYSKSQIGPKTYVQILRALAGVDRDGILWSLGLKTGKWYRQINGQWVAGEPHGELYLIRKIALKVVCQNCKHVNLASKRFCTNCGAELVRGVKDQAVPDKSSHVAPSIVCKSCGATNAPDKKFCTQCGNRLVGLAGEMP